MEDKPTFDYSKLKREDGKYEFEGEVFDNTEDLEEYMIKFANLAMKVANSKIYKLLTWRSRRRTRKQNHS